MSKKKKSPQPYLKLSQQPPLKPSQKFRDIFKDPSLRVTKNRSASFEKTHRPYLVESKKRVFPEYIKLYKFINKGLFKNLLRLKFLILYRRKKIKFKKRVFIRKTVLKKIFFYLYKKKTKYFKKFIKLKKNVYKTTKYKFTFICKLKQNQTLSLKYEFIKFFTLSNLFVYSFFKKIKRAPFDSFKELSPKISPQIFSRHLSKLKISLFILTLLKNLKKKKSIQIKY
jgi:hypothetical protein